MDAETRTAKLDELLEHIKGLVARNLPDEMTQSTMDPEYNEIAHKGVVELGYRDTRHFCKSFPEVFQVKDNGLDTVVIALRSANPRVLPPYMRNIPTDATPIALSHQLQETHINSHQQPIEKHRKVEDLIYLNFHISNPEPHPVVLDAEMRTAKLDGLLEHIKVLVARNLPDEMTQSTMDPEYNEIASRGVVELGYRDTRHFCESFPEIFQVKDLGNMGVVVALRSTNPRERPAYMSDPSLPYSAPCVQLQETHHYPNAQHLPGCSLLPDPCDCYVPPSERSTHMCRRCSNCNMKGHKRVHCPAPPKAN